MHATRTTALRERMRQELQPTLAIEGLVYFGASRADQA